MKQGTFTPRERFRRRRIRRDNIKKGIYLLPNLFTSASLFAGFYSIIATVNGDFHRAAWAIVISMICDGADGRIARMTHTTSRFGIEYDSLADLIAFGIAPGMLAYQWALRPFGKWGWSASFLFVICGALRLARFNVQIDTIESYTFNGLPIPASAGLVAATVLLAQEFGWEIQEGRHIVLLIVMFLLAVLMVSNVKFLSFKELHLRRRKPFGVLLSIIVLLPLIVNEPEIALFGIFSLYVLHGPVRTLFLWRKARISGYASIEDALEQERAETGGGSAAAGAARTHLFERDAEDEEGKGPSI
jgi:CDP-diacylglycerol--serine O-phosphatidyltransferase